jgi:hypothetical protein
MGLPSIALSFFDSAVFVLRGLGAEKLTGVVRSLSRCCVRPSYATALIVVRPQPDHFCLRLKTGAHRVPLPDGEQLDCPIPCQSDPGLGLNARPPLREKGLRPRDQARGGATPPLPPNQFNSCIYPSLLICSINSIFPHRSSVRVPPSLRMSHSTRGPAKSKSTGCRAFRRPTELTKGRFVSFCQLIGESLK